MAIIMLNHKNIILHLTVRTCSAVTSLTRRMPLPATALTGFIVFTDSIVLDRTIHTRTKTHVHTDMDCASEQLLQCQAPQYLTRPRAQAHSQPHSPSWVISYYETIYVCQSHPPPCKCTVIQVPHANRQLYPLSRQPSSLPGLNVVAYRSRHHPYPVGPA